MTAKNKKITIISCISVVIVAIIITIIVLPLTFKAGGPVNKDQISIYDSSILINSESIVIPVKMKQGLSTPSCERFYSSLSIQELCTLASEYDSKVNYEIHNDKAYLYKVKKDRIVARGVLYQKIGENLNYTLQTLWVENVIFPIHLTEKFFYEQINLNGIEYNWYAISFMTMDDMITWLDSIGIYTLEVDTAKKTIICKNINSDKKIKTKIVFDGHLIGVKTIGDND